MFKDVNVGFLNLFIIAIRKSTMSLKYLISTKEFEINDQDILNILNIMAK